MVLFLGVAYLAVVMEARVRVAPLEQMGEGRPRRVAGLRAQTQAQRPRETAVVILGGAAADQKELKYRTFQTGRSDSVALRCKIESHAGWSNSVQLNFTPEIEV